MYLSVFTKMKRSCAENILGLIQGETAKKCCGISFENVQDFFVLGGLLRTSACITLA